MGAQYGARRPATAAASRPDTAASTVLDGGAGLFVTQASSGLVLRDLQAAASPSPAASPLPRLPAAPSPPAAAAQFSKFWGGSSSPRRDGSSPRRAAGTVWRERRDQRAESEIIARQRTYEQREAAAGRRGRGRGR